MKRWDNCYSCSSFHCITHCSAPCTRQNDQRQDRVLSDSHPAIGICCRLWNIFDFNLNLEFLKLSLTIRMVTVVVIEDSQLWRKMRIMMMQVYFPDAREEDDGGLW